jgi:hypothetical protein
VAVFRGPTDPDAEALIKEARRRQRRRQAAIGVTTAAALIAALGLLAGLHGAGGPRRGARVRTGLAAGRPSGSHRPGSIPASAGATVVMWPAGGGQDGAVDLDNLRTGRLRRVSPTADPGAYQPIMVVRGRIVYVSNGGVRAADPATGQRRLLGRALAVAPSAAAGDVWLEYGSYSSRPGAVTIRPVLVSSGHPGPLVTLPRGTQLVAGTDAGLLLEPRGGEVGGPFWLWTPGTARRALPLSAGTEGFAVTPRLVAFGTQCANPSTAQSLSYGANFGYYACRTLRVLNVVTGTLRSFPAPAGTTGWAPVHGGNWAWSASEIAPSGQLMAAQAVLPPDSRGITRVFILHLTGPYTRARPVPSSDAFLLSVTAWSPDSSWLFYQGRGQTMWAYHSATRQTRSSGTRCCQYAVMATLTSPAP